ncbi:hypothetical protein EON83_01615 [bacterium]|nr:MAG: hypothetical protein EON83_01615 [bacterium]
MNANLISLPTLQQPNHNHRAFEQRATKVDQLIDTKCQLVMESARLQSLVRSQPEQQAKYLAQIDSIGQDIEILQAQIEREIENLLQSLKAAPTN